MSEFFQKDAAPVFCAGLGASRFAVGNGTTLRFRRFLGVILGKPDRCGGRLVKIV
jgi:hypothetical protein